MTDGIHDASPMTDDFVPRHLGHTADEIAAMLEMVGVDHLDTLVDQAVPGSIRLQRPLKFPRLDGRLGERGLVQRLRQIADRNQVFTSLIGMGYSDTVTPPVIQRNILENPGWYTQYTPYQAEIAQGRLEALVNFQTVVSDLTGLPLANSSLLDESTAAAEAMTLCRRVTRGKKPAFFVADTCHPQTIAVLQTRAEPLGIELRIGAPESIDVSTGDLCGILVQYPDTHGQIHDWSELADRIHGAGGLLVVATDLLACTLLRAPGEFGADVAVGNSQRFGVPLGNGGPHAGFMSTHEKHKRQLPGRLVGVSRDIHGKTAYRLALATREQHIRRDRATSNICTAQVLLAIMAGAYATYHGPQGLRRIARRVHGLTASLAEALRAMGYAVGDTPFFDTLRVPVKDAANIHSAATAARINLRHYDDGHVGVSLDETCDEVLVARLLMIFAQGADPDQARTGGIDAIPAQHRRTSDFLTHPTFQRYHSEHELLRYLNRLQSRDLSLTTSMIPLGSCTMKLNATSEMLAVTWPEFGRIHPFAPENQRAGYAQLFDDLEGWLAEITGFAAVSLQPNAGSQGEYAGLLVIRAHHIARGDGHRNVCLIPTSAHGTNPASAVMAGMKVVGVACNERGDIDLVDLEAKAQAHAENLSSLMITYPSTHGVFEETIQRVCAIIHENGGQVYLDGANMNAMVGLCRPGDFGADVCHLNLHKTFAIPHGGGGPGVGPIGVAAHLAPYLPGHAVVELPGGQRSGAVSAAPHGSASVLPISYAYIAMMGAEGLLKATQHAILNANYMASRLKGHYDILYTGTHGRVAHEFILDCRHFKQEAGVSVDDIAKRLMDFGFHAPTMSWPVAGTLMVEPTESESKAELDRFCETMITIRKEIAAIAAGEMDREDNPLHHAPHTALMVGANEWPHAYPREQAAWPAPWLREYKYWPPVSRVDNAFGDRNLMCMCPPVTAFEDPED